MSDETDTDDTPVTRHGVVVRAQNGDLIRYDPTGLVMRLSDRVIADIALRLGHETSAAGGNIDAGPETADNDALLDGIDAWGIVRDGDWLRFTARMPGAQGVRGFRRHVDGGAVLGDGPGAVLGILGLGGPSAALATRGAPLYPHHVVGPEDDIGAVGMAGIEPAPETDRLEPLRECTHEALVGEVILDWQMEKFEPLPLIVARVETDNTASATDLATGCAARNLATAARNLKVAAARMGKRARIPAVCLDYALEHVTGDAVAYRDGMLATMTRIEEALGTLGFEKPLFVARFEAGLEAEASAPLDGQWELAWNRGEHRLVYSVPSYMFARDRYDRPTDAARRQMAEMTAAAIAAGAEWRCPTLFLAERETGDRATIRVTAQGEGPLVLDGDAPSGFALTSDEAGASITGVGIADDDPQAVLVRCDGPPEGPNLRLSYAVGVPGGLRDDWRMDSRTGTTLHR
ncbi:hypothetical protein DRV84_14855 [Rhodosalinus sediminis]|uniref:Uncharacterized protein n=1 Tax=Rhodosalinus sediminis TaxID=1940533 RepID=A0A3D9BJG6_9RHOB|nr:hypothetical protein [Rhodosalinus sediminis]REC53669.1 hypothetical protein DRV84_14855 [Rhodosalinus sediminis]